MRSAIVLAGGKSRRLGMYKALLRIKGKSMITHVIDACIATPVDEVIVVVSNDEQRRDLAESIRGAVVVKDRSEEYPVSGPLLGMVTGLRSTSSDHSFLVGCDAPLIQPEVIERLFGRVEASDATYAVVPTWPNGYIEPLMAVYNTRRAIESIEKVIKEGEKDLRSMIERLGKVDYVSTELLRKHDPKLLSFFNVNTIEDLEKLQKLLEG